MPSAPRQQRVPPAAALPGLSSEQDRFANLLRNASLLTMIAGFYLAGLLLSFTPCVLPMVPILSGIIFGGGRAVSTATRVLAVA